MICKECGREMPETDKFCGICGTPNPLFENADAPAQERILYTQPDSEPVQEHQPYTQDSSEPVQGYQPNTQDNDDTAQEHQPDSQPESETAQGYQPYTQPNVSPAQEYRPYAQAVNEPTNMKMAGGKTKVKYTCSLTAVIVCVVVIFMLSVACGVFAGLYFGGRTAAAAPAHSITQYEISGES